MVRGEGGGGEMETGGDELVDGGEKFEGVEIGCLRI